MKFNLKKHFIPIFIIVTWVIYTLTSPYMQNFNTDEIWAYDIAADMSFTDIIKLMHYEGHTFLWYMLLKPFSYFPSLFPGIIKYLNWFFCFLSLIVFCIYSPINTIIKVLVVFSGPFLIVYPAIGRCYGIALLLLLLLTHFYKSRLKKPYLYAILLFFAANTCVNGAIVAFILSMFFIYDLLKVNNWNWKSRDVVLPSIIPVLGFVMLLVQWVPTHIPSYINAFGKFYFFKAFFFPFKNPKIWKLFSFIVYFPLFIITCYINCSVIKEKRWHLFVFYVINAVFIFYLFVAPGRVYHYYFLFVYLLMLYWLLIDNNKDFTASKPAYISMSTFVVAICIVFNVYMAPKDFWFTNAKTQNYAVKKIKHFIPKGSTIYMTLNFTQDIVPYLKNDYKLLSQEGDKIPSYDAYKNIYQSLYIPPEKIAFPTEMLFPQKTDNAYYIIARNYLRHHRESVPESCVLINNLYYICKLPMYRRLYKKSKRIKIPYERIVADKIKTLVPRKSVISYLNLPKDKKIIRYFKNNYVMRNIKEERDFFYISYLLTKYNYYMDDSNCIKMGIYYLCKFDYSREILKNLRRPYKPARCILNCGLKYIEKNKECMKCFN